MLTPVSNKILPGEEIVTQTVKPPLGIMPRHIHEENRLSQLQLALKRYAEAGWPAKPEWLEEIKELERRAFRHTEEGADSAITGMMRGLEIVRSFQDLTPWQREQAVQYFVGGVSMHENGFTAGHINSDKAKYALDEFTGAVKYARGRFPMETT